MLMIILVGPLQNQVSFLVNPICLLFLLVEEVVSLPANTLCFEAISRVFGRTDQDRKRQSQVCRFNRDDNAFDVEDLQQMSTQIYLVCNVGSAAGAHEYVGCATAGAAVRAE
jgi:hypothetical protein